MIKGPLGSKSGIGFALGRSQQSAVPGGWWLAGNINPAVCAAAYQAKGAASYAASKVNLANPGTHDASDDANLPSWDAVNGWLFTGSEYLKTSFTAGTAGTVILKYTYSQTGTTFYQVCGILDSPNYALTLFVRGNIRSYYGHTGAFSYYGDNPTDNTTLAVAGDGVSNGSGYLDGSEVISTLAYGNTITASPAIGGYFNVSGSSWNGSFVGEIQAIAFYSAKLTGAQIAALHTAMNTL
jgi:hypothetical protein